MDYHRNEYIVNLGNLLRFFGNIDNILIFDFDVDLNTPMTRCVVMEAFESHRFFSGFFVDSFRMAAFPQKSSSVFCT